MDQDAAPPIPINRVASVRLESFRNYASLDLHLSSAFNVLAGPNAQGKTNFLEAIYLLSTTRLLRGKRDAEAVSDGANQAKVEIELGSSGTTVAMVLARGVRKRALLNGLGLPRASDLIGRVPTVCISTEDMLIVRGEPADRRLFLDLELSALFPAYLRHLTHYKRALEQRNALLRQSQEWAQPAELFEPWEQQLAHHGAEIRRTRIEYVRDLEPYARDIHAELGSGEKLSLTYHLKDLAVSETDLLRSLAEGRGMEISRGGTHVGPHRDDLGIDVDHREARLFGSQGQQRTSVIALKMATLECAARTSGVVPMLLLDDILSDLDERRRSTLIDIVLRKADQAVLTCTEAASAGPAILDRAEVFQVDHGTIQRV